MWSHIRHYIVFSLNVLDLTVQVCKQLEKGREEGLKKVYGHVLLIGRNSTVLAPYLYLSAPPDSLKGEEVLLQSNTESMC